MKSSASLSSVTKPLIHALQRYHLVIYVLLVAGGLAIAMFSLHKTVDVQPDTNAVTPGASFDTETMERIKELQTRESANGQLELPSGRTNPLAE